MSEAKWIERVVSIIVDDIERGFWHIESEECPLRIHQDALKINRSSCAEGIETSMQGPVVTSRCIYYVDDSAKDSEPMTISCKRKS